MKEYRIPQKEKFNLDTFGESERAAYSYADYLRWDFEEIVELIKGKVFTKPPAPNRRHQEVSGNIVGSLFNFLRNQPCQVYSAPFDVRFSRNPEFSKIDSVVQPDISVICDLSKLDDRGCFGAPDLIVEIISPGNSRVELQNKYDLFEEFGVREYWIVHPTDCSLLIYTLVDGRFQPSRLFTSGDQITSTVLAGFSLDLEEIL